MKQNKGFTLAELAISLAVVSIIAVAIFQLTATTIANTTERRVSYIYQNEFQNIMTVFSETKFEMNGNTINYSNFKKNLEYYYTQDPGVKKASEEDISDLNNWENGVYIGPYDMVYEKNVTIPSSTIITKQTETVKGEDDGTNASITGPTVTVKIGYNNMMEFNGKESGSYKVTDLITASYTLEIKVSYNSSYGYVLSLVLYKKGMDTPYASMKLCEYKKV